VMPGAKIMQPTLEKVEPELLVTYGEWANEIALALGANGEVLTKYKLKDADLSMEKTACVILG
jgi:hypothetical protein